jgi:hypothetical protein
VALAKTPLEQPSLDALGVALPQDRHGRARQARVDFPTPVHSSAGDRRQASHRLGALDLVLGLRFPQQPLLASDVDEVPFRAVEMEPAEIYIHPPRLPHWNALAPLAVTADVFAFDRLSLAALHRFPPSGDEDGASPFFETGKVGVDARGTGGHGDG